VIEQQQIGGDEAVAPANLSNFPIISVAGSGQVSVLQKFTTISAPRAHRPEERNSSSDSSALNWDVRRLVTTGCLEVSRAACAAAGRDHSAARRMRSARAGTHVKTKSETPLFGRTIPGPPSVGPVPAGLTLVESPSLQEDLDFEHCSMCWVPGGEHGSARVVIALGNWAISIGNHPSACIRLGCSVGAVGQGQLLIAKVLVATPAQLDAFIPQYRKGDAITAASELALGVVACAGTIVGLSPWMWQAVHAQVEMAC